MNLLMKKFDQLMSWLSYLVHHMSLSVLTTHIGLKNGTFLLTKYLFIIVIVFILLIFVWALIQYRTKIRIREA